MAPRRTDVANDFLDTVGTDVILPVPQADPRAPGVERVYALPLSVDALVLYYNKDLLNEAEIAQPAQTWSDFQAQVSRLTKFDEAGKIVQSGAAVGTAENVERAADILSLLMMQNGTPMTDESGRAAFDRQPAETAGQPATPGATALTFYNDFANPLKEVYAWNQDQENSLLAFETGKVAYFFGYSYHLPLIRAQAPKLRFGLAPVPQIAGNQPVNFANYWVEAVSGQTAYGNEAWDFLKFVTSADQAKRYLSAVNRPTALRQLVNGQLEEADLSVFASEIPSARSWYRGKDNQAAERIMRDMIGEMLQPEAEVQKILELGAVKVNQTL